MEEFQEKINKLLLFFIIYTVIFIVFFKTLPYTLPFVLAFICAYFLRIPTRYIVKKFKLKYSVASLITTIIFFSIIILLLFLGISSIISEVIGLTKGIQLYINNNYYNIIDFFSRIQDNFNNIDPAIIDSIKNHFLSTMSSIVKSTVSFGTAMVSYFVTILSSIPYIVMVIIFTLISTYFFTKRITATGLKDSILFSTKDGKSKDKMLEVFSHAKKMLVNYILSYGVIILITFLITLIGFSVLKVKYTFLLSLLCAIFDLLPVLGMPMVYIPLIIINFFSNNYFTAIALIILYSIVFVTRQIVEPKIMSTSLGLDPVAVLAAIFIGLKANGIAGMVFCMFLVVFYNIFKKVEVL